MTHHVNTINAVINSLKQQSFIHPINVSTLSRQQSAQGTLIRGKTEWLDHAQDFKQQRQAESLVGEFRVRPGLYRDGVKRICWTVKRPGMGS